VVLYRAQGILGNHLFVLSCHVKACPLVVWLYLRNGVAGLFKVYTIFGRYDVNIAGLRPCQPLVSVFFCVVLTFILLMWRTGRAPNSIPIYSYIQQDATLHSLFISGNGSTCFRWYFHPSSGARTTVSTASGICHTVTAICRYRGRYGTGLSVLWVAYATHSTLKPVCFTISILMLSSHHLSIFLMYDIYFRLP
jgi:hypothetical protein